MNKSRREADETMAELEETKKESYLNQREGEIELEKARPDASRQNYLLFYCSVSVFSSY